MITSFSTYSSRINVTEDLGHIFIETSYIFQHISNVTANNFANNFNKLTKNDAQFRLMSKL